MTKQDLIKIVIESKVKIGENNISKVFNDRALGTSQFREIATLCNNNDVQCYDEIELLIKYNMAKDTYSNSWAFKCGSQKLGDIIVDCMRKIRENNSYDDESTLKDLSLFFGYLFWQTKVWIMENGNKQEVRK